MPSLDRNAYPARFNVIEKICEQCGNKYYASRNTAKYCSTTCRVHARTAKMASGGVIPQKQPKAINVATAPIQQKKVQQELPGASKDEVLFIPATSEGVRIAEAEWRKYFPDISFDEVWEKELGSGRNKKYFFEAHWDKGHSHKLILNGLYVEFGIYVYQL